MRKHAFWWKLAVYDTVLVAAGMLYLFWVHVRNEAFTIIGNRDEAGGWYGFWSGFAGGVRVFEWFVIIGMLWWHHSCHYSPWCMRLGRYQAAGGIFMLCGHHHPDLTPGESRHDQIHRLHSEHKARR